MLIYLAVPYSHEDYYVMDFRYHKVTRIAAKIIRDTGAMVFSPITHSHPIAQYDLPLHYDFWKLFTRKIMPVCDKMIVVTLDGWDSSIGVRAEINMALALGIPVEMMSEEEWCQV